MGVPGLRGVMRARGETPETLAPRFAASDDHRAIENARRRLYTLRDDPIDPRLSTLIKLADLLDATLDELGRPSATELVAATDLAAAVDAAARGSAPPPEKKSKRPTKKAQGGQTT